MIDMNWDNFEKLLHVAHGTDALSTKHLEGNQKTALQNLREMREKLESVSTKFREANEETILKEYEHLRKAHREFMKSFQQAHEAYMPPVE